MSRQVVTMQRWKVPGMAKKGKEPPLWTVYQDLNGLFSCNCPAWTKNMPRQDCKHILRVKLNQLQGAGILTHFELNDDCSITGEVGNRPKRRIKGV